MCLRIKKMILPLFINHPYKKNFKNLKTIIL